MAKIAEKCSCLRLIADECDEVKLFVFLCTMFPEESRIPIEDLIAYGMSIDLFDDVHDIIQARSRVYHLIGIINSRLGFKLSPEEDEYCNQYIKMNAGSHYSARKVTNSRLKFGFQSKSRNLPKTNEYKNCYGLSLSFTAISEHTFKWKYPKLALLLLKYRIEYSHSLPMDFFKGMKKLRVLTLDGTSLPQSLDVLRNLRFLRLKVLNLQGISSIGSLVSLEFLVVSTSCSIAIPEAMGHLVKLRLLDLRKTNLSYITPGVLSKMLRLEELYLPLNFGRWGSRAREVGIDFDEWERREADDCGGEELINASLKEILSLSLNALQICVPKASMWSTKSPIMESIKQFKILVHDELKHQLYGKSSKNELQLTGDVCSIKESGICKLITDTDVLRLMKVRNLKNIMHQLDEGEFRRLKKMLITECDELEYLVDTPGNEFSGNPFMNLEILHLSMLPNLNVIWSGTSGSPHDPCLLRLREVKIRFCHKLKYVFPSTIRKKLIPPKIIEILDCNELEGIFYGDRADDDENMLYFDVEEVYLYSLPKFVGFLIQRDSTIDCINQPLTATEIVPNTAEGSISGMEMNCVFSAYAVHEKYMRLKKLIIAFCDALNIIFSYKKNAYAAWIFDSLKELELYGLRNLKYIWFQRPQDVMASYWLEVLVLSECHNLYPVTISIAKTLMVLRKVLISRCDKMEEIVAKDNENDEAVKVETIFPCLKALELHHMSNLVVFSNAIHAVKLPKIEFLNFDNCNKMKFFSYGPSNTPMLKKVQIDGISCPLTGDLNATLRRVNAEKF